MSYLSNPNDPEWEAFILDCSMTDGIDILERIEDAAWDCFHGREADKDILIRSVESAQPYLAGGYFRGYINIGGREYMFDYESTNMRGSVVNGWERME